MRSILLCEGVDDAYILGYFLYKTSGWHLKAQEELSELYSLPKKKYRKQNIDVYVKDDQRLAIWSAGGKDSFLDAYGFVKYVNENHPNQGIDQLIIMTDRDKDQISDCLARMQNELRIKGIDISDLQNKRKNCYRYQDEGETYELSVIPLIIPFDMEGALETVLITGLSNLSEENAYVVEKANEYIRRLIDEGQLRTYLQHERLILKAKFSSVIAVINPERSTTTYDRVLRAYDWEEQPSVKEHFEVLNEWI